MGRKERERHDYRDQVMALVDSGRPLTDTEIQFVKEKYTGAGGLVPTNWSRGQFFTPPNVVAFIHDLIGINENTEKVIELSCGAGAFYNGINDHTRCTGMESSLDAYKVARACYPGAELYRKNTEEFFPCDGPSQFDNSFGFCIGNPPFGLPIRWGGVLSNRKIKVPSEVVFVEMAYRACKPGGKIALILPDGVLSNKAVEYVRKWLLDHCILKASISLPKETFFHAGTGCKSSILYLQKLPEGVSKESFGDYKIFFAIVDDIGWDSRGRPTKGDDLKKVLSEWYAFQRDMKAFDTPEAPEHTAEEKVESLTVETPGVIESIQPASCKKREAQLILF